MIKILLICSAGMSTSILVKKMKEVAELRDIKVEIEAVAIEKFAENIEYYDVFLLGPQIRFKKSEFEKELERFGKPVEVINTMDYGMMKGDKVLDVAIDLFNNK